MVLFFAVFIVPSFLNPALLRADDSRTIPLDLYLIIATTERFRETGGEIVDWINEQFIDHML
jgi:hypothetical protein